MLVSIGYYTRESDWECPPGMFNNRSKLVDSTIGQTSSVPTSLPLRNCQLCPQGTYKVGVGDDLSLCTPCNSMTSLISTGKRTACVCDRLEGGAPYQELFFNSSSASCLNVSDESLLPDDLLPSNTSLTRFDQLICERGKFCVNGVSYPCPVLLLSFD